MEDGICNINKKGKSGNKLYKKCGNTQRKKTYTSYQGSQKNPTHRKACHDHG